MKRLINFLRSFLTSERPEFQFPVDVPAEQTGEKVWAEKGSTRIMIYQGEIPFYKANGWKLL